MAIFRETIPLGWSYDDQGIAVFFKHKKDFDKVSLGLAKGRLADAYGRFQQLLESGEASVQETRGGVYLPGEDAVRLDAGTRECFGLPTAWPGSLILETHSVPNLCDFAAKLRIVDPLGHRIDSWSLRGAILEVGEERYLPDPETYACLAGYRQWQSLEAKSEVDHLRLIHVLTDAASRGCRADASSAGKIEITTAVEVTVDARDQKDGSILLTPVPITEELGRLLGEADKKGNDPAAILRNYVGKIATRVAQLDADGEEAILRIGNTLVLLDPNQTEQARSVARSRRVPPREAANFRKDPAKWLADHQFVHGEVEFLPRVIGIGEWAGGYLGAAGELGEKIDWFDKKPEPEKERKPSDESNEDAPPKDSETIEDDVDPNRQVPIIESNDEELRWGLRTNGEAEEGVISIKPDYTIYPRSPFPHQKDAVQWLGLHAERCGKPQRWSEEQKYWGAGALFADDMGLGKSLSTLVFLREWFLAWREKVGQPAPACLIVCPLSLVENWAGEIAKTFGDALSPFSRVVQAIPAAELGRFHAIPNGKDVVRPGLNGESGKVEQYGLTFGNGDEQSLDMPGTVVLTTYTTLRDHRFSFAGCNWSAVILDEAQNVKNPNALQTIAAKAMKGFFRVALSGTPVENHLGDLWCLMDTVEPGALGSFKDFRSRWIHPIRQDPSRMQEIGESLRKHLDTLILRRTKEEALEGLPSKAILPVRIPMTNEQAEIYDEILRCANAAADLEEGTRKTNQWLASMWELRRVSLHPDLSGDAAGTPASSETESRAYFGKSGKLRWLLEQLDTIRGDGEKVLLFAVQKKFQELLRRHLSIIYGVKISVINGDTKAVASGRSNETRLGLIEEFSKAPGFGICVLSPIAAGAGLNITAANHVIHLERHWNPAKEDQATDRAYRIGQKRDVRVYLPLLEHPSRPITTFDTGLHRLIDQKKQLAGSLGLIPTQAVGQEELFGEIFGNAEANGDHRSRPIGIADAVKLSWDHFEALIACLYERDAERVILTPRGRDHGADVLILGHKTEGNILIQVKTTAASKLDSEAAIRELKGAEPFFENAMNQRFPVKRLHTNAKHFSRRTIKAAKLYKTDAQGQSWLEENLKRVSVTMAEIISRNAHRESI
ncbi:restriction endonuclease [Akkermansiaceae bacterium]|nr:restriction endonuclease [Akkermansiaceae bacterium]